MHVLCSCMSQLLILLIILPMYLLFANAYIAGGGLLIFMATVLLLGFAFAQSMLLEYSAPQVYFVPIIQQHIPAPTRII